jgi:HD-like signal output (HDOD) protein/CheY-like chemotaxis protein
VLSALERALHSFAADWRMAFVGTGAEALAALDASRFDVLVTDMRMSDMSGVEVMEQVLSRHPHVIRFCLSGRAERDEVVRAVRLAHQYLSKPCEIGVLKERLAQAVRLRRFIEDPALQAILSRVNRLRSVPSLYLQLMTEVQLPDPSLLRIGEIVANEPGLAAKVLQLINSAYFGLRGHVSDPARAVQLLGVETIRSLALAVEVYGQFEQVGAGVNPAVLWQHSTRTARVAQDIARRLRLGDERVNEAFTAGLLHDVGKLILAEAVPGYAQQLDGWTAPDLDRTAVERQVFGAGHGEVASYLFGLWGLPFGIVEAIAWHHRPEESGTAAPCVLTAVHAANLIDHAMYPSAGDRLQMQSPYLASLGLGDALGEWRAQAVAQSAA